MQLGALLLTGPCFSRAAQGKYMSPSYRAVAFKWTAPGSGSVSLSTCNLTTADTVWEIYASSDGTLGYGSTAHLMGKDQGCPAPGPTDGTLAGVVQGQTYFFLVGPPACFPSQPTHSLVAHRCTRQRSAPARRTPPARDAAPPAAPRRWAPTATRT